MYIIPGNSSIPFKVVQESNVGNELQPTLFVDCKGVSNTKSSCAHKSSSPQICFKFNQ